VTKPVVAEILTVWLDLRWLVGGGQYAPISMKNLVGKSSGELVQSRLFFWRQRPFLRAPMAVSAGPLGQGCKGATNTAQPPPRKSAPHPCATCKSSQAWRALGEPVRGRSTQCPIKYRAASLTQKVGVRADQDGGTVFALANAGTTMSVGLAMLQDRCG
jgi:hypothetical protein